MAHGQDAALQVLVVVRLVEAVAVALEDMVHGNGGVRQLRDIVGDVAGAGVVLDAELLEFQRERQFERRAVLQLDRRRRLAGAQVHAAALAGQVRHERADQDQHERGVHRQRGRALPADPADEQADSKIYMEAWPVMPDGPVKEFEEYLMDLGLRF